MGGLISRLRAKPSTKELLEELEKEIEAVEEYKRSTEQQHRRIIGSLIFYFILLFIIGAAVFVFYYFPLLATTKEKLIYSIPLWLAPVLFYLLKKFLHWYFTQKIKYNEENLIELKKKRRSLLDFAMETETYKVVKELLMKYDPDYHKKIFEMTPAIEAPPPLVGTRGSFGEIDIKRRASPKASSMQPALYPGQTISLNNVPGPSQVFQPCRGKPPTNLYSLPPYLQRPIHQQFVRHPMQPMPRPIPPRERSMIDRIVDYLVADGPSNRYALICRQCQSHNGMALREEFDYIAFRCCYCFHLNPPRSQQNVPPRLPLPSSTSPEITEPQEVSSSSGILTIAEETDGDSGHEEIDGDVIKENSSGSKSSKSPPGTPSSLSPPGSPMLRKRLDTSNSEISAILEEDRTSMLNDTSEINHVKEE